jgi:hypothetical protein
MLRQNRAQAFCYSLQALFQAMCGLQPNDTVADDAVTTAITVDDAPAGSFGAAIDA